MYLLGQVIIWYMKVEGMVCVFLLKRERQILGGKNVAGLQHKHVA